MSPFLSMCWYALLSINVAAAVQVRSALRQVPPQEPVITEASNAPEASLVPWRRLRLKAYFVNLDSSPERAQCMRAQLYLMKQEFAKSGGSFEYERFPAVTFQACADPDECMAERPECFPSKSYGFVHEHGRRGTAKHPSTNGTSDNSSQQHAVLHGVLGNWCSHVFALKRMLMEKNEYDYFILMEDDVIVKDLSFMTRLAHVLNEFPDHWALMAVDTFNNPGVPLPPQDAMQVGPWRLHTMSRTFGTYWGAHMWLVNSQPIEHFIDFFYSIPAVPADWVPKVRHPLHLGMWAWQPQQLVQRHRAPLMLMPDQACDSTVISKSTIVTDEVSDALAASSAMALHSSLQEPQELLPPSPTTRKYRNLHIFGMMHAGVDFAAAVFNKTFTTAMAEANCGLHLPVNNTCLSGWKQFVHRTHPQRVRPEDFEGEDADVAVVVVRHPFALVRSFQQNPREVDCGHGANASLALWTACHLNHEAVERLDILQPWFKCGVSEDFCWESLPKAWNAFSGGYKALQGTFNKVVTVRYEDLVEYPHTVLDRVAAAVGVQLAKPCFMEKAVTNTTMTSYSRMSYLTRTTQDTLSACQSACMENAMCYRAIYHTISHDCTLLTRDQSDQSMQRVELEFAGGESLVSMKSCYDFVQSRFSRIDLDAAQLHQVKSYGYDANLTQQHMVDLCMQLNTTTLFTLGYHGCQDVWAGFDELVFHVDDWSIKYDRNQLKKVPNWELYEGQRPVRVNASEVL